MRCTKCSFISFDDLSSCAKCAGDLSLLSKELHGTCTETRPEFFLGSAVQTAGMEDDGFSDSQMLPPIDHSDMNFDDTSSGRFPAVPSVSQSVAPAFDDSVGVASEDDVAIELGDIMPIDLDQLDSASTLHETSLEQTDGIPLDNLDLDFDKTETISTVSRNKDIDLDLTGNFSESGFDSRNDSDFKDIDIDESSLDLSGEFSDAEGSVFDDTLDQVNASASGDAGFELDQELLDQLADSDSNLDKTTSINKDFVLNDSLVASSLSGEDDVSSLELDESLVAELAGSSSDVSGEFLADSTVGHSETGEFELDDALVAELASGDAADHEPATDELRGHSLGGADLTEEYPSLNAADDTELSGLNLSDIDVSDLVEKTDGDSDYLHRADDTMLLGDVWTSENKTGSSSVDDTLSDSVSGRQESRDDDFLVSPAVAGGAQGVRIDEGIGSGSADELSLDDAFDDVEAVDLPSEHEGDEAGLVAEIEALGLDADFEAFLENKGADDNSLPEIELIPDGDDDDGPPDLPA